MKEIIALDHINISVRNFKKSADFYKKNFNFKIVEEGESNDWGVIRAADIMICIHETDHTKTHEGIKINHFAFRVNDINKVLKRLKENQVEFNYGGGEIVYPNSSSWYITDPDGHCIEIVKWNNNEIKF